MREWLEAAPSLPDDAGDAVLPPEDARARHALEELGPAPPRGARATINKHTHANKQKRTRLAGSSSPAPKSEPSAMTGREKTT